jgi:1-acyl-sn-glycerol-3-phosphate acyltransferase
VVGEATDPELVGEPVAARWPRRVLHRLADGAVTLALDLAVLKPIALFVWWFSARANTLHFDRRREMRQRIERALASGRPVLVASNHVSWFDDPVIPMALYRTGERAGLELAAVLALALVCWALPPAWLPPPLGVAAVLVALAASARLGARKVWWTLGDLVNLSDASVLRGKLAITRGGSPRRGQRGLLAAADRVIPWFMRTGSVRTLFVDRRPGEDAKRTRARALAQTLEIARRPEPVWVFFEGGRTRKPPELAPARHGIGSLVLGLRACGADPLVIALYHHGMERLIPPGAPRFLGFGHQVRVRWAEFELERSEAAGSDDPQQVADAVRSEAARLQALVWTERPAGA